MLDPDQVEALAGATVLDADDEEVGTVADVLANTASDDRPAWVVVEVEGRRVPVPLDGADIATDEVRVRYSHDDIAGAPEVDEDLDLDGDVDDEVYDHYRIGHGIEHEDDSLDEDAPGTPVLGADDDEPEADGDEEV